MLGANRTFTTQIWYGSFKRTCVPMHLRTARLLRMWVVCAAACLGRDESQQTLSCLLIGSREAFSQSPTNAVTHTGGLNVISFSGFDRLEGKSECSQLSVVTNFLFRSMKLSAQLLEEMCRVSSKKHSCCQNRNI